MYAISHLIRIAAALRTRVQVADTPALPTVHKRRRVAQTTALALLALMSCASAQAQQRSFINLGFEEPVLTPNGSATGCYTITDSGQIPGWETTHPIANNFNVDGTFCAAPASVRPGHLIEIWRTPFFGEISRSGRQHAELNATTNSRIYQNICMVSGEQVAWRFSHRGRDSSTVPDVARFNIGAVGGSAAGATTIVQASTTNNGGGAGATNCIAGGTCTSVAGPNGWRDYSGVFNWTGAGGIQTVGFEAISSGGGDVRQGNHIDDIQVVLTPFLELTSGAYTTPEGTTTNMPALRITGTVPVAMQVPVTITGGTAVLGTDYTTPSGTSTFFVTIPAGEYPPTEFQLGLVSIGDGLVEDNLTVNLKLEETPADYTLTSTTACASPGIADGTWTLIDDDVDVLTTKSASTATPQAGVPFTYTVTYLNNTARTTVAPLTSHDVIATVADAVPTGLTFTAWTCQASGGAACPGGAVDGSTTGTGALSGSATLPAGNAAAGGLLTYQITAVAAASNCGTTLTNTSTIALTSGQTEATGVAAGFTSPAVGGTANNTASADVVPACPVVTVSKASNPTDGNEVTPGQTLTYTVSVVVADAPTSDVLTLTDTLSGDQTLVAGSFTTPTGGSCTAAGPVLTCTLPAGAAVGTHDFTYQTTVDADAIGNIGNVVVPTGTDNPTCPVAADCDTTHPLVPSAVIVTKSSDPAEDQPVLPGQILTYTVNVEIANAVNTGVITLTDTLSGAQSFVTGSFTTPAGGSCTASGQVLTCTLAAGSAVGAHAFTYQTTVDVGATGTVGNVVVPSGTDNPACPTAGDCDTQHPITPPVITVSKSADPAEGTQVVAGQTVTYSLTVTVANTASTAAVTLTDTLSAGLSLVAGSFTTPSGASCTAAGQVLTCTLPAGATVGTHVFTYQALVAAGVTSVSNVVVPSGPDSPTCPTEDDCTTLHPMGPVMTVVKTSLGAPVIVAGTGDEFTVRYSIVASNVGGSDGTYTLVDAPQYESDASIVSATATRGTDSLGALSGSGPWTLATDRALAAGAVETYTLEVRVRIVVGQGTNAANNACVANTAGNGLYNLATLTSDGESSTSNACVATPTPVTTTQLVVEKTGSVRSAEVGDVVSYSIRIRNTGAGIALLPVLVDRLPAGFRLVDDSARVRGATLVSLQGAPGPVLNLTLDRINPGAEVIVAYRVRLGVGSMQGDGINRAQVECRDAPTAPTTTPCSNTSTWKVDVNAGVFTDEGCVVGQVFVDCNVNSVKDKEELGIPGVRMYFENGTYMVSDSEGKYSYCGLRPTTHVLKVDASTLPTRSRLVTSANQNVGDANSLFIDLKNGELHRADFIEGSCNNEVIEQVKARKAQGETSSVQTEHGQPPLKLQDKQAPQASPPQQGTDSADQLLEKVRHDD